MATTHDNNQQISFTPEQHALIAAKILAALDEAQKFGGNAHVDPAGFADLVIAHLQGKK